ncbi:Acetylserotonin O-methyltransferase-like protein [Drosera capensis]
MIRSSKISNKSNLLRKQESLELESGRLKDKYTYMEEQVTTAKTTEAQEEEEEEDRRDEEAEASIQIWKYVFGFVEMAVVKCAIELGISEALEKHGRPIALSELSSALGCRESSSLGRIMRFLVHQRIFKQNLTPQGTITYSQTAISRRLLRRGENSMSGFILLESSPPMLAPWHALSSKVMAEEASAFEAAHGEDVWSYAAGNPGHSELINEAMSCDARIAMQAIIGNCPGVFDGVDSVVDVGGGDGTAMRMLVKAFPWIRGINFDLPHVVAAAPVGDGVEHVGGDMFESVPKADVAFLMWVLHDWSDDECIQILQKCKEAIPSEKGKVTIVEAVVGEVIDHDKLEHVRLMLDMVMMAHTSKGKERNFKEWEHVIHRAGFSRFVIKPIHAVQSIIEAYP